MTLDLDFVRSRFPSLTGDWVYFDNAGGSQILKPVVDRIHSYLYECNVQHGASYAPSQEATARVAAATQAMATLINAADPSEIIMGPSSTALLHLLAGRLLQTCEPVDEVIITNVGHEANVGPWADLAKHGIVVKTWQINQDSLTLDLADLDQLMTERTKLVAVTHVSNILGDIEPIQTITNFVHQRGAMICVDGVAYAPHRLVDVQAWDVDYYVFSFYKLYGPHYALLYGRRDLLLDLPGMNHFFITEDDVPYKFQPGNVNYELSYGMLGLADYLSNLAQHHNGPAENLQAQAAFAFDLIAAHEQTLSGRLLDYLNSKRNVRVIGRRTADKTLRVPTISFVVEGMDSQQIVLAVDPHQIGIRFGHFYAKRLIDDLGLAPQNGVVRVSMVHYNTLDEVEQLIKVFDGIF